MVMMRHPLSGTEYRPNADGSVRVRGKDGSEGTFTRVGIWISGDRRTADAGLCRWVGDSIRSYAPGKQRPHYSPEELAVKFRNG